MFPSALYVGVAVPINTGIEVMVRNMMKIDGAVPPSCPSRGGFGLNRGSSDGRTFRPASRARFATCLPALRTAPKFYRKFTVVHISNVVWTLRAARGVSIDEPQTCADV